MIRLNTKINIAVFHLFNLLHTIKNNTVSNGRPIRVKARFIVKISGHGLPGKEYNPLPIKYRSVYVAYNEESSIAGRKFIKCLIAEGYCFFRDNRKFEPFKCFAIVIFDLSIYKLFHMS